MAESSAATAAAFAGRSEDPTVTPKQLIQEMFSHPKALTHYFGLPAVSGDGKKFYHFDRDHYSKSIYDCQRETLAFLRGAALPELPADSNGRVDIRNIAPEVGPQIPIGPNATFF